MPLQATSGAASYDGFGGGVAAVPNYIEDMFSTYLYTGNGSTQTITNGIDLSTKGGMVWQKSRNTTAGYQHVLYDTVRGSTSALFSSLTNAAVTSGGTYTTTFNTTGFTTNTSGGNINQSGNTQVSWTFRKQPKFFDIVTYTGNSSVRNIAHNLGSVPACIIIKNISVSGDAWQVYHQSLGNTARLLLNTTDASLGGVWNSTSPTATEFTINSSGFVNRSGETYVAYLFAHNAGGFGLTGTDNVISCGSYTGTGAAGNAITLGYEPQFIIVKPASTTGNWTMYDNMRGISQTSSPRLSPNTSDAEVDASFLKLTATGFTTETSPLVNASGATYIYIAIRRGPMKVPTDATKVYNAISRTGTGATANVTGVGFPPDMLLDTMRSTSWTRSMWDRLRGPNLRIATNQTSAETSYTDAVMAYGQDGVTLGADGNFDVNGSGYTYINWFFRRAPSFFDEVCYTGTGSAATFTHNLTAVPELIIVKRRDTATIWPVYSSAIGNTGFLQLQSDTTVVTNSGYWNNTTPTSSVFTVGTNSNVNASAATYVAYLFATCAGVSKVGSYTGTATTKQIDCGFTGGARFVLIKRTDSTGDWYVWDTARGIVSGNDPYLLLNSTAAEVTSTDYIDTYSAGFELSSTAPAAINASGGTFIFLAIA